MNRSFPLRMTNRQKAAVVLLSLGPDVAADVLKHLSEEDVDALTGDVARMGAVDPEIRRRAVSDFRGMCESHRLKPAAGMEHARAALTAAFGRDRADQVVRHAVQSMEALPFEFLKRADVTQLLSFLPDEHPQTIALILAYLEPKQAAGVLAGLPAELRVDVATRIATMDSAPPEVIRQIERVLARRLYSMGDAHGFPHAGGVTTLIEMLNNVDRGTERTILDALAIDNPELLDEVKRKLFNFDDIRLLDNTGIQRLLREVETKELALALKGVSAEITTRIFANLSERAASILREDMEFMGPVRVRAVEQSQQRVAAAIRRLEESGEIVVARDGDEIIV